LARSARVCDCGTHVSGLELEIPRRGPIHPRSRVLAGSSTAVSVHLGRSRAGGLSVSCRTMNTFVKTIRNGHMAPGKLADAELHFTGGELGGRKLIGFANWARRDGSFSLLRAINDPAAQDRVREPVLQAYAADSQQVSDAVEAR
jgi:hypothetical protein